MRTFILLLIANVAFSANLFLLPEVRPYIEPSAFKGSYKQEKQKLKQIMAVKSPDVFTIDTDITCLKCK